MELDYFPQQPALEKYSASSKFQIKFKYTVLFIVFYYDYRESAKDKDESIW